MADFVIKVDNTDEFKQALEEACETALEEIGMHLEGEAKEELNNTPKRIDTGLLRNSITYALSGQPAAIRSYHADNASKSGTRQGYGTYNGSAPQEPGGSMAVYIGSNLSYAPYIHEGYTTADGKKITPNRFLKNAVEKNRDQIREKLKSRLQNA